MVEDWAGGGGAHVRPVALPVQGYEGGADLVARSSSREGAALELAPLVMTGEVQQDDHLAGRRDVFATHCNGAANLQLLVSTTRHTHWS